MTLAPCHTAHVYQTYDGPDTAEAQLQRRRVELGELPRRYAEPWGRPFFDVVRPALEPGAVILDVGAGRSPVLPPEARPENARYVGLDIAATELDAAGAGAYDETVVGDIGRPLPALAERFDLVLSWQVLEHVESLDAALDNMRAYLRPGGLLVAHLSGRFAAYAVVARVIPNRLSRSLIDRLLGVDPSFPTHYQACHASALERRLGRWSAHGIEPRYKGGAYFRFSRPLERAYLAYENWVERSGRADLATHYLIWAVK